MVHGFLFSLQWVSKKSFNCSWSSESEKTIKNSLDNKMIGYIIFIDLQMAMTFYHNILFCKLEYYGDCGCALEWLSSSL